MILHCIFVKLCRACEGFCKHRASEPCNRQLSVLRFKSSKILLNMVTSRGSSKAVVAGAGVVGALTATVLARQGWDVQARSICQRNVSVNA